MIFYFDLFWMAWHWKPAITDQKVARVKEPRKGEGKGKKKVWNGQWHKIAIAFKYGECHDSSENSDFLLLRQKDPFGELFSEIYFQSSSEFTVLWNLGKFKIQLNQPRWPMEFIQNSTFSTRQYRKMGPCLGFIFTQFVIYSLVILLS